MPCNSFAKPLVTYIIKPKADVSLDAGRLKLLKLIDTFSVNFMWA